MCVDIAEDHQGFPVIIVTVFYDEESGHLYSKTLRDGTLFVQEVLREPLK
jgi:hypothetical protein